MGETGEQPSDILNEISLPDMRLQAIQMTKESLKIPARDFGCAMRSVVSMITSCQCFAFMPPPKDVKLENLDITCGENLYYSSVPKSWSSALQGWFDERDSFTFGVGPTTSNAVTGHYTQMVWYKSYEIGCSFAFCPYSALYKHYYVCHYYPAGNVVRSATTPYKKGDPCGDCPDACDNGLCTNPGKYEDTYSNCGQIKKQFTCKYPFVLKYCAGSCQCTTEIQ
ncbi:cysteine-rich venom protein Cau1-like [Emys orbicularis]|uniref:cysteine-rich venom protein Cau1-like n=1 Tax=Emys orbicularis TaxID=82168 RepID=UPI0031FC7067